MTGAETRRWVVWGDRVGLAILLLFLAVLAFPVVGFAVLAIQHRLLFDRSHPDYVYVTTLVPKSGEAATIDLRRLNGGDWQFVCFIGAYSDPEKVIPAEAGRRGLEVRTVDRVPVSWLGRVLGGLEEGTNAVSVLDRSGRGRTVPIDGEKLSGGHGCDCFGPETTEVRVPLDGPVGC